MFMKTAISIPDEVYKSAEELATRLGKSRSQLYTQALSGYVATHKRENVTSKLNEIYDRTDSKLDRSLQSLQFESLKKEDW
jgi:metal-responsive CopG/Arc/MetJ family transcriptional regulator